MKKLTAIATAVLGLLFMAGASLAQDVHVRGYFRSDGTYVAPHWRSAPNSTTRDNWSTKGNVNPYTGKPGTRNPQPPSLLGGYGNPYPPPSYQYGGKPPRYR